MHEHADAGRGANDTATATTSISNASLEVLFMRFRRVSRLPGSPRICHLAEIRTDIRELRATVESNVRTFVVTQTSTVLGVAAIVLAYDRLF